MHDPERPQLGGLFRKPPKPVLWLLVGLLFIWVAFALALNWGNADPQIFAWLVGDSEAVLRGQVWRLLTAAALHDPSGARAVTHVLFSLLILYFFAPTLHERWGTRRLFAFLAGSAAFAFAVETLAYAVLPDVANRVWFGSMVLGDACVVAWAVVARDQRVMFWFVIPMKPMVMVWIMVGFHVLSLIAKSAHVEGMFAPFAAMGAGYLFGETSPLRRLYLKWKLRRLQGEVASIARGRAQKRASSHLRVIPGGADDDDNKRILH
jgi:membrane associated rhomboid family serine protease